FANRAVMIWDACHCLLRAMGKLARIKVVRRRSRHTISPRDSTTILTPWSGPVIPSDLLARPGPATGPARKLPGLLMCGRPSPAQHGVKRVPREGGGHGDADRSAPEPGPPGDAADTRRLRGMPDPGVRVGAPAPVPDLRARGLLRLFAAPARPGPRLRGRAPDRPVVRAGRGLAVVLCRRNLRLRKPPT